MTDSIKLANYLSEPLIFTQESFKTSDDLFEGVSARVLQLRKVREDFLPRVKERERIFPTGIQLANTGVAIPHTDAECVLEEFVAVVVNNVPIEFRSMEDINQAVEASIVFVLGLNQAHDQLEMLQSLMGLLQNAAILSEIQAATSAKDVLTIVKNNNL